MATAEDGTVVDYESDAAMFFSFQGAVNRACYRLYPQEEKYLRTKVTALLRSILPEGYCTLEQWNESRRSATPIINLLGTVNV